MHTTADLQIQLIFIEPVIVKDEFLEGLKAIDEGSAVVLENIFFEFNKTDLLPASYPELDQGGAIHARRGY